MFRKRDVAIHFVGIGGVGMSGIAEVLLNLGYRVSGSDLQGRRGHPPPGGAGRAHRHRPPRRPGRGRRRGGGLQRGPAGQPRAAGRQGARHPGDPAGRDAGRADAGQGRRGGGGLARQDQHHRHDRGGVRPGRVRSHGHRRRPGQGARLERAAGQGRGAGGRGGRVGRLVPPPAPDGRGDHQHRPRAPGPLRLRAGAARGLRRLRQQGAVLRAGGDLRRRPAGGARWGRSLLKRHVTYGLRAGDYRGEVLETTPQGTQFLVRVRGEVRGQAHIRMPGVHYAQNALAALAVADFFGVPFADYREAMAGLAGVDRRFSVRGEGGGVLVVDDYGHHPTEIAATVAAARLYGRRLVVAFQPHRYSRTRDLLADFAPALAGADLVVLTDIYAAGEAPLRRHHHRAPVHHLPARSLPPLRPPPRAGRAAAGPPPPRRPPAHSRRRRHHPGRQRGPGPPNRLAGPKRSEGTRLLQQQTASRRTMGRRRDRRTATTMRPLLARGWGAAWAGAR